MPPVENLAGGNRIVTDGIKIAGLTRFTDVAYTAAAAQSAVLPEGWYDCWSTTDCYILLDTNPTATSSNAYLLRANNTVTFYVPGVQGSSTGYKFSAIRSTADGTFSGMKIG